VTLLDGVCVRLTTCKQMDILTLPCSLVLPSMAHMATLLYAKPSQHGSRRTIATTACGIGAQAARKPKFIIIGRLGFNRTL